jgi:RNA polymerase sigma factor (sigma-70 family)
MNDDYQLLLRYAGERSESAFAELVQRHIDMVYSAALRVGRGDTYLAEDVAQIVFTELARKAATLPREILLAGWLYRTASFTAIKAVRSERRRRDREQTAIQMIDQNDQTESGGEQIAPDIDNALNQLNDADRDAIVLRFLHRCDFRAVAANLGVSEDAAQKRVSRALEKLRDILRPDHTSQPRVGKITGHPAPRPRRCKVDGPRACFGAGRECGERSAGWFGGFHRRRITRRRNNRRQRERWRNCLEIHGYD